MKIIFIYPRFEKFLSNNNEIDRGLVDYYLGDFTTPPSLGIPIMASWTPDDINIELIDDNSGDLVDFSASADLVAINCFTPQGTRAFEIADGYRAAGKKVIMGGFFPSFMVDECLKHADSVNLGEVEPTWLQIINDVRNGNLKPIYKGGCKFDLSKMRIPRRDIFYSKNNYTWEEDLVQLTRGCSYTCAMCAIPNHMGHRLRFRPIDQVVAELKTLKFENVYLADDTLFFPQKKIREYATEFFKAIIPLKKKYFVSSTMALNTDKAFLDLAAKAGVCNFYCTMNVDPPSIRAIQGEKRERQQLKELVETLNERNIRFFGSFAIGRDWDDTTIADRCIDLYKYAEIRTSEFFLFTPYPGSKQWDRLDRQGRIFDKEWSHYNGAHVVSEHPTMSRDELNGQFIKVWNDFFAIQKDRHVTHFEPLTYKKGKESVGIPMQEAGVPLQAVVTGIGFYSPIGNDNNSVIHALRNGISGINEITHFDASHFRTTKGGEIRNFEPSEYLSDEEIEIYDDRYLQYAISSARKAIMDSGIDFCNTIFKDDIALVLGTCNGGLLSAESEYGWKHGKSDKPFDEKMNLKAQYYGFGKALSAALGIRGECWLVTTACSSTTNALGIASMIINKGYYKKVLIVGSDSLCMANMSGFDGLKATSMGVTAPFSTPVGLNVGEAVCAWIIEEMESALIRHAVCYGKIAGHTTTSDAHHPTAPDPRGKGVSKTLLAALADSKCDRKDIAYINAHGTGTEANDLAESRGIAKFIEDDAIPAVSLKSFFGHCMGTTGLFEATCGILAMRAGFIPPTINFSDPRSGCLLDYVPNNARNKNYDAFISANYAFGGNNAAVVITAWDKDIGKVSSCEERVVITGTGTITSLGVGTQVLVQKLKCNETAFSGIDHLELCKMRAKLGGFVKKFDGKSIDRRIDFSTMNPISSFATVAASLACNDAGLRVSRRNADDVGIVMGVCNGPSEMEHMDSIYTTSTNKANIASFSNITANSTAGWVSNALCLKGVNSTLSPGPHAGLSALAYAYDFLSANRANQILVGAADEIYAQTYFNYDLMNFLFTDDYERNYQIRYGSTKQKVLGEGAAFLLVETLVSARMRSANILAEVCGYGMSMDATPFTEQSLSTLGLEKAVTLALSRSGVDVDAIDLILWAPQGNVQDKKVVDAVKHLFGLRSKTIPFFTTTFNTGYIESASILVTAAAFLESMKMGNNLFWPQITGDQDLDQRAYPKNPNKLLLIASSDLGYNFSVVLGNGNCV